MFCLDFFVFQKANRKKFVKLEKVKKNIDVSNADFQKSRSQSSTI